MIFHVSPPCTPKGQSTEYVPCTCHPTAISDVLSPRDSIPGRCSSLFINQDYLSTCSPSIQPLGREVQNLPAREGRPHFRKMPSLTPPGVRTPPPILGCLPRKWLINIAHVLPAQEVFLELSWQTLRDPTGNALGTLVSRGTLLAMINQSEEES